MSSKDESHRDIAPVTLGSRMVGPGQPVYVVAEAGVNHDGDLATALAMVETAKEAGADAVKFQAFRADRLVTRHAASVEYQQRAGGPTDQYDMLRGLELWPDAFAQLSEHCRGCQIDFLATPFAPEDVAMLVSLQPVAVKIASTDLTNTPLLQAAIDTGLALIISTGAAEPHEINATLGWLALREANTRLVLLHCVSSYPTQPEDANLRRIASLATQFGVPAGFSDHTTTLETGALAAAAGAVLIEKHFTLSQSQPGPDHFFSLEPDGLAAYVTRIRLAEEMLGSGALEMSVSEQQVRQLARCSLVAATDIFAGQVIRPEMLAAKRPGGGIDPSQFEQLIGRSAISDIPVDTQLTWEMVGPAAEAPAQ
jgi:sialic acid synthase SpsE